MVSSSPVLQSLANQDWVPTWLWGAYAQPIIWDTYNFSAILKTGGSHLQ